MSIINTNVKAFVNIENSLLEQFSRTLFERRRMNRNLIQLALEKNDIRFIQIQE